VRNTPNVRAERHRREGPYGQNYGFFVAAFKGRTLRMQVSAGGGWDHVSVSLPDRCPTWEEMSFVKDLFFRDDEVVMQLHPAKSEHVNFHPYCLHLWRPQTDAEVRAEREEWERAGEAWPGDYPDGSPGEIPLPPTLFVGPKGVSPAAPACGAEGRAR
jgi:hypothetical protein